LNAPAGRVLALDVGEVRVGLALSDPMGWTAQPHGFVPRHPKRAFVEAVRAIVETREVVRAVVGLPLLLSGEKGARAVDAESVAAALREALDIPVETWDERLTTVQAERALREGSVRRADRRRKVDAVAAAVLLQSYLDAGRSSST
jgi:putative Holliday junction resolvase